jgi:4'-phosphopantetheinyl transferase EntD
MISEMLPSGVASAEAFSDPPDAILFPAEEALLVNAVEKRRLEFRTTRHCARTALAGLGVPAGPILRGPGGAPCWPDGVVGSMTHCVGYRAAAVAHRRDIAAIGIDAELHRPLPDGVLRMVALAEEQDHLRWLTDQRPAVQWPVVLFSAKESVYKTWYPVTGRWLGFEDAEITIDPDGGTFTARLLVPPPDLLGGPVRGFRGRWRAGGGLVLTTVACAGPAAGESDGSC